jgi:hypothetical protein
MYVSAPVFLYPESGSGGKNRKFRKRRIQPPREKGAIMRTKIIFSLLILTTAASAFGFKEANAGLPAFPVCVD